MSSLLTTISTAVLTVRTALAGVSVVDFFVRGAFAGFSDLSESTFDFDAFAALVPFSNLTSFSAAARAFFLFLPADLLASSFFRDSSFSFLDMVEFWVQPLRKTLFPGKMQTKLLFFYEFIT